MDTSFRHLPKDITIGLSRNELMNTSRIICGTAFFYVKDEANMPYIVSQFRDKLNHPTSVDFITALQGFTGSGGHPLEIIRQFQAMGVLPKEWTERDFDGKAVMIIDDAKDIPSRWSQRLAGKPYFVK